MRNLRACLLGTIVVCAAACGDDGGGVTPDAKIVIPDAAPDAPPPPDAPTNTYDFSCMGNAAPTTAPDPLTLSGTAQDINIAMMALEPVAMATVTAHSAANDAVLGTPSVTDMNGDWSISAASGGTPVDGYVEARKGMHRTTRVYPPAPLSANFTNVPILILSNSNFDFIAGFAGFDQMPTLGAVGVAVLDCANTPVEGATLSVTQNGAEVGEQWEATQLQPGTFLVFNVPVGETTVNASFNNMTFRAHVVDSVAQTTSTTVVRPGF